MIPITCSACFTRRAPSVVHVSSKAFDVYIGRDSHGLKDEGWGNPHVIGVHGSRDEVIARYESDLLGDRSRLRRLQELHGKRLGCWCDPSPCHGHVLAHYAGHDLWDGPVATVVGSRDISEKEGMLVSRVASTLAAMGFILRSGNATGTDQACARGAPESTVVHLSHRAPRDLVAVGWTDDIRAPAWHSLSLHPTKGRMAVEKSSLLARNWHQVGGGLMYHMASGTDPHGGTLIIPRSDLVVCLATPDPKHPGQVEGGTGQTVRVAHHLGVPVVNLRDNPDAWKSRLRTLADEAVARYRSPVL